MIVRIKLTDGITAMAVNLKRPDEKIVAEFIELDLPSRDPPANLSGVLEDAVGREFTNMALDAVYRLSALAALKEVIC